MKKKRKLRKGVKRTIRLFGAIMVFLFGLFVVEASGNIEATGITIKDQSSTMTVEDPVLNNGEITSNITFEEVGDYVLFDVTLKNNKSSEYKIKSVTDNNENENLKIEYDYDEKIGVGGTGSLKIKMTYKTLADQDINIENLIITITEEDGSTDEVTVNPKTSDNILRYVLLLLVSMAGVIFALVNRKTGKAFLLIIVALLMIPTIVFASENLTLKFVDIEIKAIPKTYVINYDPNGGEGEMAPQEMTYDVKANLTENGFTNGDHPFKEWNTKEDGSGDSYEDGAEVENLTTDAEITLYAQWKTIATLETGSNANIKMKNLAAGGDYYDYPDSDEFTIEAVKRSDALPDGYEITEKKTISDESSENPIYIFFDEDTNTIYWYTEAEQIYLNSDSSHMFDEMESLKDFSALAGADSSKVTSIVRMFACTYELEDYSPLEGWVISGIDSLDQVFSASNFGDLDLVADWDVSQVTSMNWTFSGGTFTSTEALVNWDVSNVTSMTGLFECCEELTDLSGLAGWEVGNVTDMYYMFNCCTSLTDLSGIEGWDTSGVTNMSAMFRDCHNLASVSPMSNWDVSNVTDMSWMFYCCYELDDLTPLSNWNNTSLTSASLMFAGCYNASGTITFRSNIPSYYAMFEGASTEEGTNLIVNYTSDVTNIDAIIATKSSGSHITKGSLVTS